MSAWMFFAVVGTLGVLALVLRKRAMAEQISLFPAESGLGNSPVPSAGTSMATLDDFAQAIAQAEGYGVPGAIPTRANNPGDLSEGDFGDTGEYLTSADGTSIIVFPSYQAGLDALKAKLAHAMSGQSSVYSPDMSILDFAGKYAPSDSVAWAMSVASALGVSADQSLSEVIAS